MQILGLCFAATITSQATESSEFFADLFGLPRIEDAGADFFALPDGNYFAVAEAEEPSAARRSVGFRVADLSAAVAELRAAGVEVGEPSENSSMRYAHFVAPDQQVYELVEFKSA